MSKKVLKAALTSDILDNTVTDSSNLMPVMQKPQPQSQSARQTPNAVISEVLARNAINSRPVYSEQVKPSMVNNAINSATLIRDDFQSMGQKPIEQRARIGGRFGAGIGATVGQGPVGALIGSGVGAMVARGTGMVQNGQYQQQLTNNRMLDTLQGMKVLNNEGGNMFEGSNLRLGTNPDLRLQNMSTVSGAPDRDVFSIDQTNPMARRATSVARPLARFLVDGIMGSQGTRMDPTQIDSATGMFVNMFTDNTDNIDTVYKRARQLVNQFGANEDQMRTFFNSRKSTIDPTEAAEISKGLEVLYA